MKTTYDFSLTDILPVSIILLDNTLNFIEMNTHARLNFDVDKLSLINLKDLKFYEPNGLSFSIEKCITSYFKLNKKPFSKSVLYKTQDGVNKLFFMHVEYKYFRNSYIYICVFSDISSEIDCLSKINESLEPVVFFGNRIIGQNEKMKELHRLIGLAADSNATVIISGESGTGKELVADAIHTLSERANKPLIKVNCASLSETLLESELFGHVKGSFTGAFKDKTGKFELAHRGTIFLDEISEISPSLQVKLLRVIQEKTIERVGDNKQIKVDMRIIAATNKNLRELIKEGKFREDLFYRLNVFPIQTTPLRERKNDIPLLCKHFIEKFNKNTNKNVQSVSADAYRLLMDYCWPGNVRELENVIEHAFVVVKGQLIDIFDFPQELRYIAYNEGICKKENNPQSPSQVNEIINDTPFKSKTGRLLIDKETLIRILEKNNWNQTVVAQKMGISRVALWKKIKKFNL